MKLVSLVRPIGVSTQLVIFDGLGDAESGLPLEKFGSRADAVSPLWSAIYPSERPTRRMRSPNERLKVTIEFSPASSSGRSGQPGVVRVTMKSR